MSGGQRASKRPDRRPERRPREFTVAGNSPFAEWDKTFGDPRLCAVIADRITFRCTLIQTGTESYRFRGTEAEGAER
ncbi:ATP-binding protein [Streptomyces sp. LS1784]|uniref:ATP-binding protein n=1 Tax=Streptomyces sp. LS1784 TaxID=2851533 RepID=UPI0035A8F817